MIRTNAKALVCASLFAVLAPAALAGQQVTYSTGAAFPFYEPTYSKVINPQNWTGTIGGGMGLVPRYEGSDRFELKGFPVVNFAYSGGVFFAGTQGIGFTPLRGDKYHVAFGLGFDVGRDEDDDKTNLRGMGDVDPSLLAFLNGEYNFGPVFVGGEFKTSLAGDYGSTIEAMFGTQQRYRSGVTLRGDVHTTWADGEHMDNFFGVTPYQATRSGKRVYSPDAGIKDFGLGLGLGYDLTRTWTLNGKAVANWLTFDASDSPLSIDDFQPAGYMGLMYKF